MKINPKVIDLFHSEEFPDIDFEHIYRLGYRGVIHKVTEGLNMVDAKYAEREVAARKAGLLWGAYHFMRPGDASEQAHHFLDHVGDWCAHRTVMVLDHEDADVPLWKAQAWLLTVQGWTKQTPWLYSGFLIKQQLAHHAPSGIQKFPLWLAEYGSVAKIPQPWTKYAIWQFTDGVSGPEPHSIPGVEHPLDISHFDGSDAELRALWGEPEVKHELVASADPTAAGPGGGGQCPSS